MTDFIEPNPAVMAQAEHKSAESMVAAALLSVCAATGLAAWGLATFGGAEPDYRDLSALYRDQLSAEQLQTAEDAVIADWQGRLDEALSKRESAAQQQQQSVALQQQAQALEEAQAAIAAARQAAKAAEARAQAVELARQKQRREQQLAKQREAEAPAQAVEDVAVPSAALTGEVVDATIDWDSCRKPIYPIASVRLRQQGEVLMSFAISAEGMVESAAVVQSSGTSRLDNAALNALQRCRFNPKTIGGVAQASNTQLKFTWRLNE